jgi:phosphate transport system substrate-binding protein
MKLLMKSGNWRSYNSVLTVIVNPANKVSKLTREHWGIFTGAIKTGKKWWCWRKIVAYSRESSSGTYEFF